MKLLFILAQIGGGLVLFLFSIGMLSNTLKQVSSLRLRSILKKATDNPLRGAGVGTLVTFIVQSSSVTVLLLLGLVNAGIMNLRQAIYVILGSEIGTTITAQIVAFKLKTFFYPLLIVGFAMRLLFKKESLKHIGDILLFIGMIFLAMKIMTDGSKNLQDFPEAIRLLINLGVYPVMGILVGAVLTAITNSSSATTSLVIAMSMEGVIGLQSGIALIIGANIGTCVLELVAAIGTNTAAKRTGMAQFVINIFGALIFYPFLGFFAELISMTASDLPRLIANAHAVFNITVSLVMMPLVSVLIYILTLLIPDKGEPYVSSYGIMEDRFLTVPALALYEAEQELNRMASIVTEQLGLVRKVFFDNDKDAAEVLAKNEDTVDVIHEKAGTYLHKIGSLMLNERDRAKKRALVHTANDLERIADLAEKIAGYSTKGKVVFSDKSKANIEVFLDNATQVFNSSINSLKAKDPFLDTNLNNIAERLKELKEEYQQTYQERLREDSNHPVVDALYPDVLKDIERVTAHAKNIAENVMKMK